MRHAIILGCGRSGTSIFGELFEHLSPFAYYSEPAFDDLLHFDFSRPVAVKVPRESANHPATPGLSFPLETLLETVPGAVRLYWQVRHPLDTICSLRVGISQNWGHHPKPPDWQDWLERPLVERCAHHWAYINTVGYRQVQHLVTVKTFEEMLGDPLQFARSVGKDVGSDVSHERELAQWAKRVQNTNNEHFVEAETSRNYSRPDHTVKVERWKENLTWDEVKSVLPFVREAAPTFGYSLPGEP